MKKYWAFFAADDIFQGLHGMNETGVIIADSREEAEEYAASCSDSVINSYDDIIDELEEQIEDECDYRGIEYDAIEAEDVGEEVYTNDRYFQVYELDTEKLPTLDVNVLTDMFDYDDWNGSSNFLDKYIKKEV